MASELKQYVFSFNYSNHSRNSPSLRNSLRRIISILVVLLSFTSVHGQLNVTAALDSAAILLGDHIHLHYRITKASSTEYVQPDFKVSFDTMEQVELVRVLEPKTSSIGNNEQVIQSVVITSFKDGMHQIPGVRFSVKDDARETFGLANDVYLRVDPIPIDTTAETAIRPIKEILEEKKRITDWIHYVLIPLAFVLLILLVGFLVWRLSRKKSEESTIAKPKIVLPAHTVALDKLRELEEKKLWENGQVKEYYSGISYIAREYLENRYKINALESVTHEIAPELKRMNLESGLQEQLLEILRTADLVKFAKVKPAEETHHKVIGQLRQFVDTTQQRIIVLPDEIDNKEI